MDAQDLGQGIDHSRGWPFKRELSESSGPMRRPRVGMFQEDGLDGWGVQGGRDFIVSQGGVVHGTVVPHHLFRQHPP
jgi:hypothetical protein